MNEATMRVASDQAEVEQDQADQDLADRTGIGAVVNDVWSSMTGMALQPARSPLVLCRTNGYAVASVQIMGEINYVVRLELQLGLLQEAASRLLQAGIAELSADEIRDAAGELANVVGGNLKRIWSDDSRLSLPVVVVGTDFEFLDPQGARAAECSFVSEFGNMNVVLLQPRH